MHVWIKGQDTEKYILAAIELFQKYEPQQYQQFLDLCSQERTGLYHPDGSSLVTGELQKKGFIPPFVFNACMMGSTDWEWTPENMEKFWNIFTKARMVRARATRGGKSGIIV